MSQTTSQRPRPATPRQAAVKIVRVLHEAGHVAYFAGGCVRDALLGLKPKDYDVATDAPPQRVLGLFRDARYVGEAFGVVRVRLMHHDVEVATFRLEGGYDDGRHPRQVRFTDARHDARRRDFTINGLFENPLRRRKADRVIDYVDGQADLKRCLIRAIGAPAERFAEDYLRMLRAVRFAARLRFRIEADTAKAIVPLAGRLGRISRERIGQELEAMLTAAAPGQRTEAVRLIQRLHLDGPTFGEPHAEPPTPTVAALPGDAEYPTVLAAWLLDRHPRKWGRPRSARAGRSGRKTAQPDAGDDAGRLLAAALGDFVRTQLSPLVQRWRKALCLSNDDRDNLRRVLPLAAEAARWSALGIAQRKRLLAQPLWRQAWLLLGAICASEPGVGTPNQATPAAAALLEAIDRDATALLAEGVAPRPWVDGDDLIALGRKPGPEFGRLLETAYDAQLEGTVRSRAEALARLRKQR